MPASPCVAGPASSHPLTLTTMSSEEQWRKTQISYLETLGIVRLVEWDVLVFVNRHGTSLAGAPQIARLLGYGKTEISAALDALTLKGLLHRSHDSKGLRLYRTSAPDSLDPPRLQALAELLKVAEDRAARLLISGHLRSASGRKKRGNSGLHLASSKASRDG